MLEAHNLSVTLDKARLLADIDLQVSAGDYLCIVGPNGAGKTTLLRALAGLLPSQGQVHINNRHGHTLSTRERARQLAYVPQGQGRELPFIVTDFIAMSRYPHHHAFSGWQMRDTDAVEAAIQTTGIEAFRHRRMRTLSGGEAQRVMIAAALAQQTPLILLDEPTSFLDPHHQHEIEQLIRRLNIEHGITVVEVTHDINHASQHACHILALKNGRTDWQGRADEFMEASRLQALYQQSFVLLPHPQTGRTIALKDEDGT